MITIIIIVLVAWLVLATGAALVVGGMVGLRDKKEKPDD